jgi:hypothetical protein
MKKINILILILLSLTFIGCSDEGGGVIVTQDPPPSGPTTVPGPFGGPINNDDPIPPASAYNPPYNSDTLQALVDAASAGDTIFLDRDAQLTFPVAINKPLKIQSEPSLGRRAKIRSSNSASTFSITVSNVELSNLEFDLANSSLVASGEAFTDLVVEKSLIKLRGTSSFNLNTSGAIVRENTILGLATSRNKNLSMVELSGSNITFISNIVVDVLDSYRNSLFLSSAEGMSIQDNILRCFCEPLFAPVTLNNSLDIILRSNLLHDRNTNKNNALVVGTDLGSVAISFQSSSNISDSGFANSYAAQIFRLDDEEEGDSTLINLSPGLVINPFGNDDLFNFLPTEDFTPICNASNLGISLTPRPNWRSYVGSSSGNTYYYPGAIKPACL